MKKFILIGLMSLGLCNTVLSSNNGQPIPLSIQREHQSRISVTHLIQRDPHADRIRGEIYHVISENLEEKFYFLIDNTWVDMSFTDIIFEAVVLGLNDTIQDLITQKAFDVNSKNDKNESFLHVAARCNNPFLIDKFLENGIEANAQDNEGNTPLMTAVLNENNKVIRVLLKYNQVDPNIQKNNGYTPLHVAARYGNPKIIRILLRNPSCVIDPLNSNQQTPLDITLSTEDFRIIRILAKAMDSIMQSQYFTEAQRAVMLGNLEDVKSKINSNNVNEGTHVCKLPLLHLSLFNKDQKILPFLLEFDDINVNKQTKYKKNTALHIAIQNHNFLAIEFLLAHKNIKINKKNIHGNTPLHIAVQLSYNDILGILLTRPGTRVNVENNEGTSPLLDAVGRNNFWAVMALLESNADIRKKNNDGNGVFHEAAFLRDPSMLEFLLKIPGGNVNRINADGENALFLALEGNYFYNAQLLIQYGISLVKTNKNNQTILHILAKMADDDDGVQELFPLSSQRAQLKLICDKKDWQGNTALHIATTEGNQAVGNLLLDLGPDICLKDSHEKTALHYATYFEEMPLVQRMILQDFYSINIPDNDGNTPLHIATITDNLELVQFLVQNGADIHLQNHKGQTPLDMARERATANIGPAFIIQHTQSNNAIIDYLQQMSLNNNIKSK